MKILIKDGTTYKTVSDGDLVDTGLSAPPTESDFNTHGFDDIADINTEVSTASVTDGTATTLGGGAVFEVAIPADLVNVTGGE